MRRFVEGIDRGQATLFPEYLEDWIDADNPVRAIDAFVDKLDLSGLGFDGVAPEATGRPSYHPSVLLKLYIYGYLVRVQSSRRLEREAGRNVEVMWLTGRLIPDHKTIADFRKDSGPAIKQVCVQFIELCRLMGLLTHAERCDRWQQVQGRQYPRQELHAWEGGAAARPIGEERGALSCATRHRRPAGAIGRASGKDGPSEGEADQAGKRDAAPSGDGEADAGDQPISRSRSPIPTAARWRPAAVALAWSATMCRSRSIRNIT